MKQERFGEKFALKKKEGRKKLASFCFIVVSQENRLLLASFWKMMKTAKIFFSLLVAVVGRMMTRIDLMSKPLMP